MIPARSASLESLAMYLTGFSGVELVETGEGAEDDWWIDISLDTSDPDAWQVVQTIGTALNAWEQEGDVVALFFPCPTAEEDEGEPDELRWRVRGLGVTPGEAIEQLTEISRRTAATATVGM